ncbi:TonB family protein [Comamonas sp. JC664]|uniref:TonB family protein n=1 Tax=Comamonas sp. JC664 TaxID=2801917 RepID=UPI00174A1158|nr:TonB family protein [Comamonas sp. JC664]MBL0695762.1 TonB family protein [Comamonas sp. JC664]GHG63342.1 hypothetical protein GCM10012319_02850 [Comamonas sp. KCTC 72670]
MASTPTQRLLTALVASLGVHGLLWLALEGGERVPPPPPPAPVAALEWVDVEVVTPPVAQAAPEPDSRTRDTAPMPREASPGPATRAPEPEEVPSKPDALARDTTQQQIPPDSEQRARDTASRPPQTPSVPLARDTASRPPQTPSVPLARDTAAQPTQPRPEPLASGTTPQQAPSARDSAPTLAPPAAVDVPRAEPRPSDIPVAGSRLLLAARQLTPLSTTGGGPVAELDAGVPDGRASPSAQALVEDIVSESVGRGRVDRGLVHPYYGQLGKALMKAWDADRSVKEHGLQGYFDMGMERGRAYSRVWMERAADYGASGSFAAKNGPGEDRRRPISTAGDPTLNARRELRQQMRQEFRTTRRALIRVVQDAQGQLLDVQLLEPSHQPEVDKEAIKDVRAAAEKLPPPPAEAVGSRVRISSVWEFELIISISPPIPTFSFEFDEALGFIDTRLPLDRRIYKRVRLVEVR